MPVTVSDSFSPDLRERSLEFHICANGVPFDPISGFRMSLQIPVQSSPCGSDFLANLFAVSTHCLDKTRCFFRQPHLSGHTFNAGPAGAV